MKHKSCARTLCTPDGKNLSKWNEAIAEAKRQISILKKSIRSFESFRDNGVRFPEPEKKRTRKDERLLRQAADL